MNNEPVAIRYDFDGYGYQYMDSGSGSDWQSRVKGEPLYTHPVKELTDDEIAEVFDKCYQNNRGANVVTTTAFARAILRKAQEQ